jgi:hypothetical protein
MELKMKNDVFYLLAVGEEKWLFDTEDGAIEALKGAVSRIRDLAPERVSILEVNTSGEKWEIRSVPWAKIALKLMKGGK